MDERVLRQISATIFTTDGWTRYANVPEDELIGRMAYQLERFAPEERELLLEAFSSPDVALDGGCFLAAIEERAIETEWINANDRTRRGLAAVFRLPHPVRTRTWNVPGFACWGAIRGEEGMLIIKEARP